MFHIFMHLTPTFLYKFIIEKHKFKSQRSTSLEIEKHKYDQYHHNVTEVQDAEEPHIHHQFKHINKIHIFLGEHKVVGTKQNMLNIKQ